MSMTESKVKGSSRAHLFVLAAAVALIGDIGFYPVSTDGWVKSLKA